MGKYRKKPVVVEAMQFVGENILSVIDWCKGDAAIQRTEKDRCIVIHTREGSMRADLGDWIIKGVKGEFYLYKPDIFEATYEPVEAPHDPA